MAISYKEFEEGNFTVLRGKAYLVLEFLKTNKDKAYLSKEIADAIKITTIATTPILKKLIDNGLVEKKDPYYVLSRSDKKIIQEESKKKAKPIQEETIEEEFEDEAEPYEGEEAEAEPQQQ